MRVTEVRWSCPPVGWHKANVDGAAHGQPGLAACGGIFRTHRGYIHGCYAMPLGVQNSMYAELMGVIRAIEIAVVMNWFPLWIESDSEVLVQKLKKRSMEVPWSIKNRWRNALDSLVGRMYMVTHIYREGNYVADALANMGLELDDFTWWYRIPRNAERAYERNLYCLSEYRFRF
ncbi:hypothetical protein ACHQM5_017038 [Ranunculus cassubicifolius]